jgi:hypothetical protein
VGLTLAHLSLTLAHLSLTLAHLSLSCWPGCTGVSWEVKLWCSEGALAELYRMCTVFQKPSAEILQVKAVAVTATSSSEDIANTLDLPWEEPTIDSESTEIEHTNCMKFLCKMMKLSV